MLQRAVNFICDAPDIKAISFVGGGAAGKHIHQRGTGNGKRVQSNMAAKNHCVIMPDAAKVIFFSIYYFPFLYMKSYYYSGTRVTKII